MRLPDPWVTFFGKGGGYGLPVQWAREQACRWHGGLRVSAFLLQCCALWWKAGLCVPMAYLCSGKEDRSVGFFLHPHCTAQWDTGIC